MSIDVAARLENGQSCDVHCAGRSSGLVPRESRVSMPKNVVTNQSFSCNRTLKWIYLVDCPRLVEM